WRRPRLRDSLSRRLRRYRRCPSTKLAVARVGPPEGDRGQDRHPLKNRDSSGGRPRPRPPARALTRPGEENDEHRHDENALQGSETDVEDELQDRLSLNQSEHDTCGEHAGEYHHPRITQEESEDKRQLVQIERVRVVAELDVDRELVTDRKSR